MVKAGTWPSPDNFYSCSAFHSEKVKPVKGFDLREAIIQVGIGAFFLLEIRNS